MFNRKELYYFKSTKSERCVVVLASSLARAKEEAKREIGECRQCSKATFMKYVNSI